MVAAILPNIPAHCEAHFGVPAAGAVLNAINTRLEADTIAYILDHGEARVVLCDTQFLSTLAAALELMENPPPPRSSRCPMTAPGSTRIRIT